MKKKNSEPTDLKKSVKAIEEYKLTVLTKILICKFNIFLKFMCTDKNNDQNKTNLPPLPFHFSYVTAEKLPRL